MRRQGLPIILFGLECQATTIILSDLISAGVDVRLLCMPGRHSIPLLKTGHRRTLPMAAAPGQPGSTADVAQSAGVDVWRIGDPGSPEVHQELMSIQAELVVVACYNRLLPKEIYADRRFGGLNIHPSLLPDKRGPDPLFWVFRNGDEQVGSTVHRLTESFDAGDILAQESMPKPDGISENDLDAMLSRLGSKLVQRAIADLVSGDAGCNPQNNSSATWAPHPSPSDFTIDREVDARTAFNFVRGVGGRGHPIKINTEDRQATVAAVHGWQPPPEPPRDLPEDAEAVQLANGWLVFTPGGDPA